MKLALFLFALLVCADASENPMLRALAKPAKKVKVCACSGKETALKCTTKNLDPTKADELVAAGSAALGKCDNNGTKFEVCKCNNVGKCHTIKVAAPAVAAQVKKASNTLGACAPPATTPPTGSPIAATAAPTSAPTAAPTSAPTAAPTSAPTA